MNVEQILQKESLDQILLIKKSVGGEEDHSEDQMMIVGNYLDLPVGPSSFFNQQSLNSNDFPQITLSIDNPLSIPEYQANKSETQPKKRSVFHNFQKHLMTTLRSHINIRKSSHSDHSQSNIASQLWQYFKYSARISKRFLFCLLFGRPHETGTSKSAYYEDYCRIVEEFNEYTEEELNTAQAYLCREIIRQSKKLVENKAFETRRINHSEEFKKYFKRFVDQLESGKISKRIAKTCNFSKIDESSKNNIQ